MTTIANIDCNTTFQTTGGKNNWIKMVKNKPFEYYRNLFRKPYDLYFLPYNMLTRKQSFSIKYRIQLKFTSLKSPTETTENKSIEQITNKSIHFTSRNVIFSCNTNNISMIGNNHGCIPKNIAVCFITFQYWTNNDHIIFFCSLN